MSEAIAGQGTDTLTGRRGPSGGGVGTSAGDGPSLVAPAYFVAAGGVLLILRLPFVAIVGVVLGMALVLAGVAELHHRATDPQARRRLALACALAVVVAALTVVLELLPLLSRFGWEVAVPGGLGPGWMSLVTLAQTALGALGTGLVTVALARESTARGWSSAASAWWAATGAIVLVHGPIVAATGIVVLVGRSGGVHGLLGLGLFALAVTPYVLIARAGTRSGPPLVTSPAARRTA